MKRKHIIPFVALLTFTGGMLALFVPFLPFGWFLLAVTALLLLPYFKIFERAFEWIVDRDNSGIASKAGKTVSDLYRWAGDHEKADRVDKSSKRDRANKVELPDQNSADNSTDKSDHC